mmetsp:Transcript_59005/g.140902  ORF Transcript_59005/g.140902 Transcript_59005/m.140902 type:complete len:223 (+) Transcript_59005:63-731(+)
MLNVEEFVSPELALATCHVKESVRIILNTVVVCRSIGGHRPMEPRSAFSDIFDLSYMKTDEPDLDQELDRTAEQASDALERHATGGGQAAQLVLNFFTMTPRKQSVWNLLVGSEDKIVFEQWRFPLSVQPLRRCPNPAMALKEEANAQASAASHVVQALQFVVARATARVEHLPPPPQYQAPYRFETSLLTLDGKPLGGSTSMSQALASSVSQSIKHMPYIA